MKGGKRGEGRGREGKGRMAFKFTCPIDSESNCDGNGGCPGERRM